MSDNMHKAKRQPNNLKLVDYDNPILRAKTAAVTFPLSQEIQDIIEDMIYSIQPEQLLAAGAPWDAAVGMAANQWGLNYSIFLYCPTGDTVDGLEVIINPSYEPLSTLVMMAPVKKCEWEGCFSVPLATGNIERPFKIRAKYQDMDGKLKEKVLSGWPARVWQHETDHLNGHLYDDPRTGKCLEKKVFNTREAVEEFYAALRSNRAN